MEASYDEILAAIHSSKQLFPPLADAPPFVPPIEGKGTTTLPPKDGAGGAGSTKGKTSDDDEEQEEAPVVVPTPPEVEVTEAAPSAEVGGNGSNAFALEVLP